MVEERLRGNELAFKVDEGEPLPCCIDHQAACMLAAQLNNETTELTIRRVTGEPFHLTQQTCQQLESDTKLYIVTDPDGRKP